MRHPSACLVALVFAAISPAALSAQPAPLELRRADSRLVGGPVGTAKAAVDTVLLLGPHASGAPAIGTFESSVGLPDWNGWTTNDESVADRVNHWHAATFEAVSGVYSAWCGSLDVLSCSPGDQDGGYGRSYHDILEWRGAVTDPAQPCTVSVAAVYNIDTMYGYDYFYVRAATAGGEIELFWDDGLDAALPLDLVFVYQPGDYVGADGDEVAIQFLVTSDGGWDGADCLWPNDGAVQLDDVAITLSNGAGYAHDFEDGTLGELVPVLPRGVGDFAQIWTNLADRDPCVQNATPQVAFIDDGQVVPGTGGSPCIQWCYGPGGYVCNTTGGVAEAGVTRRLASSIDSPPLAWADSDHDGGLLTFSVYRDETLGADAAGVFYRWQIRSVATGDAADLAGAPWRDRNYVYYGGPNYHRFVADVSDLLVDDRTHVQVRLGAYEMGWLYGWTGDNASPAPYFDNVRLQTFPAGGPQLSVETHWLATDRFPAAGPVDPADLGAASVAFDGAAYDVELSDGSPVDSLTVRCVPLGSGATLTGPPQLHYLLRRNPVFDPYRTAGLPDAGAVDCVFDPNNPLLWQVDLPDAGFLFPGDRLHYFFTAEQDRGGQVGMTILPADTTGFSRFADWPVVDGGYDKNFAVRGLPSVSEVAGQPGAYASPPVLFWHDSGRDEDWAVWQQTLNFAGLAAQVDIFHTRDVDGIYCGLGAVATADQLSGYDLIIVGCGEQKSHTIDIFDGGTLGSPDVFVVDGWLRQGGRNLVAVGNGVAWGLEDSGYIEAANFLQDWFDVGVSAPDVTPLIGGQSAPRALTAAGNPVLTATPDWLAYGQGCSSSPTWVGYTNPRADRFDAIVPGVSAVRLAEWAAPDGSPGGYPYAAATWRHDATFDADVVLIPTAVGLIWDGPSATPGLPTRAALLRDILDGIWGGAPGAATDVPAAAAFAVTASPNPFNPATEIAYTIDRPGHLTLRVYDVRGRLVRTLHDGPVVAAGSVTWDGRTNRGDAAPSGVYFYEARLGAGVRVGKLALVK